LPLPSLEVAEQGFSLPEALARSMASPRSKLQKYPTSVKVYWPNGKPPQAGDIFTNPISTRAPRP
jgi:gamma-glutamyltranspeptidase